MSAIPLLKFTPSAMDTDFLEAITVQREPLIQGLVDSALDADGGNRHHLLVGPRGMGKSHVLTLVAERIRAAADDSLVLAVLNEDPWAVRSYSKLLAAILGAIDHPEAAAIRSRGIDDEAELLLREAVGDRRLILIVENLDEIFRRIGPDGQKRLRALGENWGQLLVLASTPQLFAGVNRHASPFYAFFRITHLDELTPENAGDLLRRIARLRGDEELASFLETETARRRILAINALAGGHPRIWLLFAGCISIPAIDELVPLFLEAFDELTPYYQARLATLGDQQQELVLLLCEAGGALSNRALAERSGLKQNQVGAMLGTLEDRGYVRPATLPKDLNTGDARASYWELREPLMRLALDVKASRARPLAVVVDFLRAWYDVRILDEMARIPTTAHLAAEYAKAAFQALRGDFDPDALTSGSAEQVIARAERGLQLSPGSTDLLAAHLSGLLRAGRHGEAQPVLQALLDAWPTGQDPIEHARTHLFVNDLRYLIDENSIPEPANRALELLADADLDDPRVQEIRGRALEQLGQYEDAAAAFAFVAAHRPNSATAHQRLARIFRHVGRDEDALASYALAAAAQPRNISVLEERAETLRELGRLSEAEEAICQALSLAPNQSSVHLEAGLIALETGDVQTGRARLRESLIHWRARPNESSDVARVMCGLYWQLDPEGALVADAARSFAAAQALGALGQAFVATLPELAKSPEVADAWLGAWVTAIPNSEELAVPLAMTRAGLLYAETHDRAKLLALPAEQREIVVQLLQGSENRVELGDDVA